MLPMPTAFDLGQELNNAFSTVASFVPKLILFAVILLIGLIVAKAVEKIIDKVLERVGFDRLVERGGLEKALAQSKYDASSIVGIAVVAIGGGGIAPLKSRWEKTLSTYDAEKPKRAQAAANAPSVLEQAQ